MLSSEYQAQAPSPFPALSWWNFEDIGILLKPLEEYSCCEQTLSLWRLEEQELPATDLVSSFAELNQTLDMYKIYNTTK